MGWIWWWWKSNSSWNMYICPLPSFLLWLHCLHWCTHIQTFMTRSAGFKFCKKYIEEKLESKNYLYNICASSSFHNLFHDFDNFATSSLSGISFAFVAVNNDCCHDNHLGWHLLISPKWQFAWPPKSYYKIILVVNPYQLDTFPTFISLINLSIIILLPTWMADSFVWFRSSYNLLCYPISLTSTLLDWYPLCPTLSLSLNGHFVSYDNKGSSWFDR